MGLVRDSRNVAQRFKKILAKQRRDRAAVFRGYFATHRIHKLHIGAGDGALPGWLNTDIDPGTPKRCFFSMPPDHFHSRKRLSITFTANT